jgi:hypothetical protein
LNFTDLVETENGGAFAVCPQQKQPAGSGSCIKELMFPMLISSKDRSQKQNDDRDDDRFQCHF